MKRSALFGSMALFAMLSSTATAGVALTGFDVVGTTPAPTSTAPAIPSYEDVLATILAELPPPRGGAGYDLVASFNNLMSCPMQFVNSTGTQTAVFTPTTTYPTGSAAPGTATFIRPVGATRDSAFRCWSNGSAIFASPCVDSTVGSTVTTSCSVPVSSYDYCTWDVWMGFSAAGHYPWSLSASFPAETNTANNTIHGTAIAVTQADYIFSYSNDSYGRPSTDPTDDQICNFEH